MEEDKFVHMVKEATEEFSVTKAPSQVPIINSGSSSEDEDTITKAAHPRKSKSVKGSKTLPKKCLGQIWNPITWSLAQSCMVTNGPK